MDTHQTYSVPLRNSNWLTATDISLKFNAPRHRVFDLLKKLQPVESMKGYRRDAKLGGRWRVEKRRKRSKPTLCVHRDDVTDFCRRYGLDIPKTKDWLSSCEIIEYFSDKVQGKVSHDVLSRVFRHLRFSGLHDKHADKSWTIAERKQRGAMYLCLHASELDAFGAVYHLDAPLQEEGWLTAAEIAEKQKNIHGSHHYQKILYRFEPSDNPNVMHDPVKKLDWPVRIFNVKGKPLPCLWHEKLESFTACYRLYEAESAPATPEWLSVQDLANYLGIMDSKRIQIIFDRVEPLNADTTTIAASDTMRDPVKNCVWRMRRLAADGSCLLHESQIEVFIRKYLLYKLPDPTYRPLPLWCT